MRLTTRELYRDKYGTILYDSERQILELELFEETATMNDEEVKGWLERYATFGEKNRTKSMLINAQKFRYKWGPGIDAWRNENIIPRYNKAGIKKFAFLFPPGKAPPREPAVESPAMYPTGYFDSREKLIQWFQE